MIVGYVGLFFGRLIKAAVSRQREYLADASAVQFTRNHAGIGGALKKIGGLAGQSYVNSPAAETASHMFFGSAVRQWAYSPFGTHPPLVNRIRAIDPQFDGIFPNISPVRPKLPAYKTVTPTVVPPSESRARAWRSSFRDSASVKRFPSNPPWCWRLLVRRPCNTWITRLNWSPVFRRQ